MSETRFRHSIRDNLKRDFLFDQIESRLTAPGIPDTHYFSKKLNVNGFMELKYEKSIPKKIDLRKNQVVWLRRYSRYGGNCFVVVKISSSTVFLWPGQYAMELRKGQDIYNIPHHKLNFRDKNFWDQLKNIMLIKAPVPS